MAITVADLQVRARADVRDAQRGLQGVQGTAERTAGGASAAMGRIGPAVQRGFTAGGAIIGAGLLTATDAAVTLADEMQNVATVVPTADLAGLTDEVQELSRASGQTTSDLTGGLYDLVSAGVSAEDAMSVLSASTNLAIGGLGTTAGAADVVTSAMNAYAMEASKAGGITDVFALAIQRGKVTADEIGASIANIAPVASSAGVGLDEVAAGYGSLTAKGVPAAQAATQMRAAISALLTPNETLNKIQEQTGQNFADIAAEKGLAVALEELRVATAGNATELDKLAGVTAEEFPSALAAAQDALGLTNTEVERFSAMAGKDGAGAALAELAKEVGEGDSAFGRALGSIEGYQFALNTTGGAAEAFQGQLGDYSEALEGSGVAAEQAAIKMESPAEAGKRLLATFQTFMQDVGGPFASSLGPVVFALNQMGPAFGGVIRMATLAGGALGAVGGKAVLMAAQAVPAVLALAAPFAVPIAIIAGVVAAVAGLYFAWTNNLFGIRDIAANVWNAITGIVGGAVDFIVGIVTGFVGFLGTIWNGVTGAASAVWNTVSSIIGGVVGVITGIFSGLISFVSSIWSGVSGAASAAWGAVTGVVSGAVSGITGIISSIVDVARGVWDTVSGIFGAIGDAAAGVGDFVGGVGDTLTGWIPSFQGGTTFAPEGPAYLHRGEVVLPPDVSAEFRRFFAGGGDPGRVPAETILEGDTNINVTLPGATRAMGPEDVARPLRRLAALGTW